MYVVTALTQSIPLNIPTNTQGNIKAKEPDSMHWSNTSHATKKCNTAQGKQATIWFLSHWNNKYTTPETKYVYFC